MDIMMIVESAKFVQYNAKLVPPKITVQLVLRIDKEQIAIAMMDISTIKWMQNVYNAQPNVQSVKITNLSVWHAVQIELYQRINVIAKMDILRMMLQVVGPVAIDAILVKIMLAIA